MRIGVNARFLLPGKMEGFGWYSYEVIQRMVKNHPEHTFVLFFDRPYDSKFIFGKNVEAHELFPPARHAFLFLVYFGWSLKKALKKHKVDVLFSPDGFLSLRSNVPQVNVIHDLNFEHFPEDIPYFSRWYLKRYFPKFAKKATHILTVSEFSKKDIIEKYGVNTSKITVAWNGVSEMYQPISTEEKLHIKQEFTQGNDYFIFVGALHKRKNVMRLIKAFQLFSKENASIDLLIVGTNLFKNQQLDLSFLSEKEKERIHFTGHLPQENLAKVMASASALTYFSYFEGFGIPLVEAMKCGVPVLCGNKTSLPEVVQDAALLCDPMNIEEIKTLLIRFSKDEILQKALSAKSLERAKQFNWNNTEQIVWETLMNSLIEN